MFLQKTICANLCIRCMSIEWLNNNAAGLTILGTFLMTIGIAIWRIATKYSSVQSTLVTMQVNFDSKFDNIETQINDNFERLEKNLTTRMDETSDDIKFINERLISNIRDIAVLNVKFSHKNGNNGNNNNKDL